MLNRWVLMLAPLAFFGIAGTALYLYFMNAPEGSPFHDSLVPELIGFCLEGFFLVGLFTFFQELREHERRKALWLSLRGSLRQMLSHLDIAFLPADAEPMPSRALERDAKVVERLLAEMKESELELESMVSLKKVAVATLPLAHDLIPVAAQLSAAHMRWWIAIVDNMKRMSEARDRAELEHAVYAMLLNLAEFDHLRL